MLEVEVPAANVTRVHITDDEGNHAVVLFSYATPVAVFLAQIGQFVDDEPTSRTTAQHIRKYATGDPGPFHVSPRVIKGLVGSVGFNLRGVAETLASGMKQLPDEVQVELDRLLEEV